MGGFRWLTAIPLVRLAGALWLALGLICGIVASAQAETEDELQAIRAELQALQQGQTVVQQELAEIKQLLMGLQTPDNAQAQAAKPPAEPPLPMQMTIGGSPYLGEEDAPVVLIEFTDYQCPFCRRHFEQTHSRLIKEFVDTGKLRIVLKEFPLQKLHPLAPRAAMAAQCAGDQQNYWPMHDLLFQNQTRVSMDDLESYAASLELDTTRFLSCMEQGQFAPQIRADFDLGVSAGVRGTPFFYIGPLDPSTPGVVTVERFLYGAHPYETFAQVIDGYLKEQQVSN